MTTYTFNEVIYRASKRVKCAGGCGRSLTRSKKFWQTLNPFNKMPDGSVKTEAQVRQQLYVQAKAWEDSPETCIHCDGR